MEYMVPIVGFLVAAYIVKVLSESRIRKMIIRNGQIDENVKYLFSVSPESNATGSLKWGMVLLAFGLGLFVANILDQLGIGSDELTFGLMLFFGGCAMIAYYFLATRLNHQNDQ